MTNTYDTNTNIQSTMSEIKDLMQKYNACLAGQLDGDENTYADKAVEVAETIGLTEEDVMEMTTTTIWY
jgi:cyanate lyase